MAALGTGCGGKIGWRASALTCARCGELGANRIYKQWASIFNNDAVLTSALLDRLLHHAETVRIEGKSYRSKDQIEI